METNEKVSKRIPIFQDWDALFIGVIAPPIPQPLHSVRSISDAKLPYGSSHKRFTKGRILGKVTTAIISREAYLNEETAAIVRKDSRAGL